MHDMFGPGSRSRAPHRRRLTLACAFALLGFVAAIVQVLALGSTAFAAGCGNEAVREQQHSTFLPDCRGYEQVSPPQKNGYDVSFGGQQVAANGSAVTYVSFGSFAGSDVNNLVNQYIAKLGPNGWTTEAISPPIAPTSQTNYDESYESFSENLEYAVFRHGNPGFDGALPGFNLYRRNLDGTLQLLTPGLPEPTSGEAEFEDFQGASANYSHILFRHFNPRASEEKKEVAQGLYEWNEGVVSLVGVLPDGEPEYSGSFAGSGGYEFGSDENTMSANGSRIYWSDLSGGKTYLRQNGVSVEATAPQCTTNPNCPEPHNVKAAYWAASREGSEMIFTSQDALTNNASQTATRASGGSFGNLYAYDAEDGRLTDLTVDEGEAEGAGVEGVIGGGEELSYIYFVARGVLAPGAVAEKPNLYVRHDEKTKLVATLEEDDTADWKVETLTRSYAAQVSKNGEHLLFTSTAPLTPGYENAGESEVYLYDAPTGKLTCVSCDPSGAAATGAANLAGVPPKYFDTNQTVEQNMSEDGDTVFFESTDRLLPQDSNGLENVYEWEAQGTGGCQAADGCLSSISTGTSSSPSYFMDTNPSGEEAFFLTREQLVGADKDQSNDLYVARVGGGRLEPEAVSSGCEREPQECHGLPAAPALAPPIGSETFSGPGNRAALARPRLLKSAVHGSSFTVRVHVAARGRVSLSGAGIAAAGRSVAHAGTYALHVHLSSSERKRLAARGKLRLALRLRFTSAEGATATTPVILDVKGGRR